MSLSNRSLINWGGADWAEWSDGPSESGVNTLMSLGQIFITVIYYRCFRVCFKQLAVNKNRSWSCQSLWISFNRQLRPSCDFISLFSRLRTKPLGNWIVSLFPTEKWRSLQISDRSTLRFEEALIEVLDVLSLLWCQQGGFLFPQGHTVLTWLLSLSLSLTVPLESWIQVLAWG